MDKRQSLRSGFNDDALLWLRKRGIRARVWKAPETCELGTNFRLLGDKLIARYVCEPCVNALWLAPNNRVLCACGRQMFVPIVSLADGDRA